MLKIAILLSSLLPFAAAQTTCGAYGQCGGQGWTACTSCVSGYTCQFNSQYYSQCIPLGSTTTTSRATTTTTTVKSSTTATTTTKSSTTTTKSSTTTTTSAGSTTTYPTVTGFVGTSGQKFTVNGGTYMLLGENAWYLAQLPSNADIDKTFTDIAATGATTVRTWGFNEVTSPSGTYYHLWSGSTATINTGANGLAKFDYVVASAKAHGLRLMVALTNNWSDYGGMDVYVKQILNSADHDYFYSNAQVISAYQSYVSTFVNRYKTEPAILAWELGNEPRCGGSSGTTSGTCTQTVITSWIKTMSSYIKSIDSNHLVCIGDEGFGLAGGDSTDPYQYNDGMNFATNLAISTVDFGTVHLYPGSWGESNTVAWGNTWITNHVAIQKSVGKPTILEEYGVTGSDSSQATTYTSWLNTVLSSGMSGDLIWQATSSLPDGTMTPSNDGYGVAVGSAVYQLLIQHFASMKQRG